MEDGRPVPPLAWSSEPSHFSRPARIRGVYVSAWAAGSASRSERLIGLARRTELNTFVIDIKDASGSVSHPTDVRVAQEIGADQDIRIRDLPGLLDRLERAGIYPIARIVIAKDPILTTARPELAVQDSAGGTWTDDKGSSWADFYRPEVWSYNLALAREVAELGFPEIQWDYVRFPDGTESVLSRAAYRSAEGRTRVDAVREFVERAREELADLDVRVAVDVFGLSAVARDDVGIGQHWEHFIGRVDTALPMVYPSHYGPGIFGIDEPNAHPYEIVRASLSMARDRSDAVVGAGSTIPWLQDFTLGAPSYGGPEVRAQIQATYDAGIQDWLLWNPSSRYSEAALLPTDGLPAGVELAMRVGGRVVPVSERSEGMTEEMKTRIALRRLEPVTFRPVAFLEARPLWGDRIE